MRFRRIGQKLKDLANPPGEFRILWQNSGDVGWALVDQLVYIQMGPNSWSPNSPENLQRTG